MRTRTVPETSVDVAERRFLDALKESVRCEVLARQGLVTRAKQAEASRASRALTAAQRDLTNLYLRSILGTEQAIDEVMSEAPHDSAGEEWTDG